MNFFSRKSFFINFLCILLFIHSVINQNSKVKKISFFNDFQEAKSNKLKFVENYLKHFENLTRDNQLTFKRIKIYEREAFQAYLKEKQDITQDGIKLFRINKKFVMSLDKIKNSEIYKDFYKYIKCEKDSLAMSLLHEITLKEKSPFYFYLRNIPALSTKLTPLLFDHSSLSIFSDDDTHQEILNQVNNLKVSYNSLRRLLFSTKVISKDYFGQFSFGDYLWVNHVVKYYTLKLENSYLFIPGTEYLNINGIMNLENALVNCCLKYSPKDAGDYYEVYANVAKEAVFEFYDNYENVNKILLNPAFNNEELFTGFVINGFNDNPFDYVDLDMNLILRLNQNKTNSILPLSCNENDLRNLDYYLKNISNYVEDRNDELVDQYLNMIVQFISNKVFSIDRIFEQHHEIEFMDEVAESYNFLTNKKNFLNSLVECVRSKILVSDESADEFDKMTIDVDSKSDMNLENQKEDL